MKMTNLTPDELKAMRERCEAARNESLLDKDYDELMRIYAAHARTDIPKLLDEVERLKHGILRLKDTLRSIDGHVKGIRTYAGAIDEAISNVCMEVTTNDN